MQKGYESQKHAVLADNVVVNLEHERVNMM